VVSLHHPSFNDIFHNTLHLKASQESNCNSRG
jgi:hypothetical protein